MQPDDSFTGLLMGAFGYESNLAFWYSFVYVIDSLITLALWAERRDSGNAMKKPKAWSARWWQNAWITWWWSGTKMGAFLLVVTLIFWSEDSTRRDYPPEDPRCQITYWGPDRPEEIRREISPPYDGKNTCTVRTYYYAHNRYSGHYVQHALQMGASGMFFPVLFLRMLYGDEVLRQYGAHVEWLF